KTATAQRYERNNREKTKKQAKMTTGPATARAIKGLACTVRHSVESDAPPRNHEGAFWIKRPPSTMTKTSTAATMAQRKAPPDRRPRPSCCSICRQRL